MRVGAVRPNRPHRLLARVAAACTFGVGLLAVCSTGTAGATPTSSAHPLIVYSSEGYGDVVAQYFRYKTGIPVQVVTNKLDALSALVQSTKRHPQWGVLWTDGPTVMASLDGQHFLVKNLHPTVSWNALGLAAVPKDKSFLPPVSRSPQRSCTQRTSSPHHRRAGCSSSAPNGRARSVSAHRRTSVRRTPSLRA